jgi:hypothetical protein
VTGREGERKVGRREWVGPETVDGPQEKKERRRGGPRERKERRRGGPREAGLKQERVREVLEVVFFSLSFLSFLSFSTHINQKQIQPKK